MNVFFEITILWTLKEEIYDETDQYVEVHKRYGHHLLIKIDCNLQYFSVNFESYFFYRITINMPISGNSPETATWASELASPISPYRSSPLSPSIMISTLLRSPINSPYRQSPFHRPTLHATPPAQPLSVLSPDSIERYYYLSPSRVRNVSLKKIALQCLSCAGS